MIKVICVCGARPNFIKIAALVLTDSGGMQEETTILGVPCMTLRENTERPVTIAEGTNRLVHATNADSYRARIPKLWDGRAAERIVRIITELGNGI